MAVAAIQAATAISGGMAVMQQLEQIQFPKLKRTDDGSASFKLSIRILGAAIPGLDKPGLTVRQRPFIEAKVGGVVKDTEYADYNFGFNAKKAGAGASECPWRFNETLTFSARLQDVYGMGLKFRLRCKKERSWGILQFDMAVAEVGEGGVDLHQRVLPSCVQEKLGRDERVVGWSSPMMLVPLQHVKGGVCGEKSTLGEAVAHLACIFTVDSEPDAILQAAETLERMKLTPENVMTNTKGAIQKGQQQVEQQVKQAEQHLAKAARAVSDAGSNLQQRTSFALTKVEEGASNLQQRTSFALNKLEDHTNVALKKVDQLERQFDEQLDKMVLPVAEPIAQWASNIFSPEKSRTNAGSKNDGETRGLVPS